MVLLGNIIPEVTFKGLWKLNARTLRSLAPRDQIAIGWGFNFHVSINNSAHSKIIARNFIFNLKYKMVNSTKWPNISWLICGAVVRSYRIQFKKYPRFYIKDKSTIQLYSLFSEAYVNLSFSFFAWDCSQKKHLSTKLFFRWRIKEEVVKTLVSIEINCFISLRSMYMYYVDKKMNAGWKITTAELEP